MKCVCGYDDEETGADKFISIESPVAVYEEKDYRYVTKKGTFYVCPKCGTVKMEKCWW